MIFEQHCDDLDIKYFDEIIEIDIKKLIIIMNDLKYMIMFLRFLN